jgi:hypothetical protein
MSNESRIVNCRGCGGTGQQGPYSPLSRAEDCIACGGTGKKRMG